VKRHAALGALAPIEKRCRRFALPPQSKSSAWRNLAPASVSLRILYSAAACLRGRGAGCCCIADFPIGRARDVVRSAGLETRDTADLEVCATLVAALPRYVSASKQDFKKVRVHLRVVQ
jgi:hypothetical protein